MLGLADAHNHLDAGEFDLDREEVVLRAHQAGVSTWLLCSASHERWDRTEQIAQQTGGIAFLGVHPWSAALLSAAMLRPWIDDLARRPLVGIGEIGLDVLHASTEVAHINQRHALRIQLALARQRDLPVALHCVRAYPEMLAILERDGVPRAGGMIHAWTGPPDQIERALRLGLYISFGPDLLRDRAKKPRASSLLVPDGRLLVETDCPSGRPLGRARGEPADLVAVIEQLAVLRGQQPDHVGRVASANLSFVAHFGLQHSRP